MIFDFGYASTYTYTPKETTYIYVPSPFCKIITGRNCDISLT